MTTVAPLRRNHDARGTQAFRVGSMTSVTSESAGNDRHSFSSSSELVRNRRPLQRKTPLSSARLAWWAARQATSIPSVSFCTHSSLSRRDRRTAPAGRSCRTFTNRDPTEVGHRVPNRTFLPRRCPRSAHPQQARSRQTLRSVSSDAERAPVTSELSAAGRTNGGSKGTISLNVAEHLGREAITLDGPLEGFERSHCGRAGVDPSGQTKAGMVVEDVHDPDLGLVGEEEPGGVDLPQIVG